MNNEINTSLVAKMPATPGVASSGTQATSPQSETLSAFAKSGNNLPSAETSDRQNTSAPPDRAVLEEAAKDLSRRAAEMGRDLRFDVDEDSGVSVIKVIDPATDEVVRQIPSEEAVDRARQRADADFNLINETA